MVSFLGILFDGVAYGSLLFLISVGLSVVLGLMNIVNLAHGAFAMFGGYMSVWLMDRASTSSFLPWRLMGHTCPFGASAIFRLLKRTC